MNETRESADDYARVILTLSNNTRIISCRDGIQWILQKRTGGRWRAHSYIRHKDSLLRHIEKYGIELDPTAQEVLEDLPPVHPWGTFGSNRPIDRQKTCSESVQERLGYHLPDIRIDGSETISEDGSQSH